MSLYNELMNDVLKKKREAILKGHVGGIKEIRIQLEWFDKLVADPKMRECLICNGDDYKINGIPLIRTTNIDKWEVIV